MASSKMEGTGRRVFAAQQLCLEPLLQFQAKKSRLGHTVYHQAYSNKSEEICQWDLLDTISFLTPEGNASYAG